MIKLPCKDCLVRPRYMSRYVSFKKRYNVAHMVCLTPFCELLYSYIWDHDLFSEKRETAVAYFERVTNEK